MAPLNVSTAILRTHPVNCKKGTRLLVIRGPRQRNNSWTDAQRMAMLDSIMIGFQCTVYIIQDQAGSKKCDEVFDGAHKLETVCDFVSGKFPIKKASSNMINWETSPLNKYIGKYYNQMSEHDQLIFDNYEFTVNIIPPEIAEDPDQLTSLWIRLNNSGNRVNDYESYRQIYRTFYDFMTEHYVGAWKNTAIYPNVEKKKKVRGEVETELMRMLALSEADVPTKFISQDDIWKKWQKKTFGETSKVEESFIAKKADLSKRLEHLHTVYTFLDKKNLFKEPPNPLVRRMLISRVAYWCDSVAKLTHCSGPIIEYATKIFKVPIAEFMKQFGCMQANAPYQRRLLDMINREVQDAVSGLNGPRAFTSKQVETKLAEQGGNCTWCSEPIKQGQKRDAHHIKPYRDGGKTTLDNLAVLHEECHKELHSNPHKKQRTC